METGRRRGRIWVLAAPARLLISLIICDQAASDFPVLDELSGDDMGRPEQPVGGSGCFLELS